MRKNRHAGFSLVEMLIAMLMSMIIILGVAQFLVTSTTNYEAADKQVDLQMEAQSTLNCITDMILESNNVLYEKKSTGSGAPDTYIYIYENLGMDVQTKGADGNTYTVTATKKTAKQKILWFDSDEEEVYLFICDSVADYEDAIGSHSNKNLLAEGVTDMTLFFGGVEMKSGDDYAKHLKDVSYGLREDNTVDSVKNEALEVRISLHSPMTATSANKDVYTYEAKDAVAPRSEVVSLQ